MLQKADKLLIVSLIDITIDICGIAYYGPHKFGHVFLFCPNNNMHLMRSDGFLRRHIVSCDSEAQHWTQSQPLYAGHGLPTHTLPQHACPRAQHQ